MAPRALILIAAVLLAGCKTTDHAAALSAARQAQAVASARIDLPNLDASCTAKTGRVYPTTEQARVITQKRWLFVADNRDRLADDCAAWWAAYKTTMEKTRTAH